MRTLCLALLAGGCCYSMSSSAIAESGQASGGEPSEPVSAIRPKLAAAVTPPQEGGIADIVVTAQRRRERLQDVPLSVSAFSAQRLQAAAVVTTTDLTNVTPGLVWARSTAFSQPTIRGVGSRNASVGDESNVAVYLDGVYQPEQFATIFELANIERVEILKGPQGTLFGRNATGGAVSITTRKPSFTPTADVTASYGRFDYKKATAYVSGPIIGDTVAASLTALTLSDGGYIRNVFLNKEQGRRKDTTVRGQILFNLAPSVELVVNGLYSRGFDNVTFSHHPLNGNTQVRSAANPTGIPLDVLIPTGDFQTSSQFVPYDKTAQYAVDGHLMVDLGGATLATIGSFQRNRAHVLSDSDGSPLAISYNESFYHTEASSLESVLSSNNDGRLHWVIGANGFLSKAFQTPLISNGVSSIVGQRTRAASVFGEVTDEVLNRLFLTGGLRYTYDLKESYNLPLASGIVTSAKSHSTDLSPRAVARFQFDRRANVYASYSRGFKSATYNPLTISGALTPAKPEKVSAFEVGLKTDPTPFLRINVAAYHYDYKDLQVTVTNTDSGGGIITALQNAPKATINGVEFNADFLITHGLTIHAGASYLHTRIDDFPNASVTLQTRAVGGLPAGNTNGSRNVSGSELLRAPRYTANIGLDYTTRLGSGKLALTGNILFSDKFYVDVLNRLYQPKYKQASASVTWTGPGDRLSISVFGQNLTNDRQIAQIFTSTLNDVVAYQKPRWFGVTLGYKY